jgi:hypothetical protein
LATSGIEENAMRLLGAFYDLSGGKLTEPVSLGRPEIPGEGAAPRADLEPESTECEVATRYLINQGYIAPADATSRYVVTVAGFDRVRDARDRRSLRSLHYLAILLFAKEA